MTRPAASSCINPIATGSLSRRRSAMYALAESLAHQSHRDGFVVATVARCRSLAWHRAASIPSRRVRCRDAARDLRGRRRETSINPIATGSLSRRPLGARAKRARCGINPIATGSLSRHSRRGGRLWRTTAHQSHRDGFVVATPARSPRGLRCTCRINPIATGSLSRPRYPYVTDAAYAASIPSRRVRCRDMSGSSHG